MRTLATILFLTLAGCSSHLGDRFVAPEGPFVAMAQEPVRFTGKLIPHTLYLYRVNDRAQIYAIEFLDGGAGVTGRLLSPNRDIRKRYVLTDVAEAREIIGRLLSLSGEYERIFGNDYTLGQSNHFAQWILDRMPELKALGWRLSDLAYGKDMKR